MNLESAYGRVAVSTLGTLSLIGLWYVVASLPITGDLLPDPVSIVVAFLEFRSLIVSNFWFTAETALIGYFIAVVLAVVSGVLLTWRDDIRRSLMPLIVGGNTIPRITLAPLLVFYISGFKSRWMIVAWMAYLPMLINTVEGFGVINDDLENLLEATGASKYQQYKYVRLYNGIPFLLDGMKISLSLAVTGAVVVEFILSQETRGIGYLVYNAMNYYQIDLMFASVMLIAFGALALHILLFVIQDRLIHWQESGLLTGGA
jgi:NitT/TauT family transport system permease protein